MRGLKITKLVVGILMLALAAFIIFQSAAAGIINAMSQSERSSGTSGIFTAILYIASGVVYISTKNRKGMGGDIACLIMLLIVGLLGFTAENYKDLVIWAWLAVIIGVVFFVWHLIINKKAKSNTEDAKS